MAAICKFCSATLSVWKYVFYASFVIVLTWIFINIFVMHEISGEKINCIILDDDDDDEVKLDKSNAKDRKMPKKIEKRLIAEVRKHRLIYDNKHKFFSNAAKKNLIWQNIADALKVDVDICKSTWAELRHKYQCHARRLRKHFLNITKKNRQRPTLHLESRLCFLWRYIDTAKYCPIPYDIVEPTCEESDEVIDLDLEMEPIPIDDDLILIEPPVELIVIDEDDEIKCSEKVFHVNDTMKTLIEHVKKYPELYDSTVAEYKDYSRKSFLWNSIAGQIGDKATKLMKFWIIMQTRYEWEISRNLQNVDVAKCQTQLQKVMEFFEPFILACPDTVYKYSYYLKQSWHDPIDYFKDIYSLIARMKRVPDIVYLTNSLLHVPEKNTQFFNMWNDLAKTRNNTVGQCETTWLIMRNFYCELMNMRKQNYQLTDKWYFEVIITELYDLVKECKLAKQDVLQAKLKEPPTIPKAYITSGAQTAYPLVHSHIPHTTVTQQTPLPKITSAISLAAQFMSGASGSLQIRPIGVPQPNVTVQPHQQPTFISNSQLQANSSMPLTPLPNNSTDPMVTRSSPAVLRNSLSHPLRQTRMPLQTGNLPPPTPAPRITIKARRAKTSVRLQIPTTPNLIATTATNKSSCTTIAETSQLQTPAPMSMPKSMTDHATPAPLPKISQAVSLLNPNEILIELIASQSGNHLVVHGPPLSEKYHLSMPTVAEFIREILAIPLLHNKRHNQPHLINSYWEHISKKFNLPPHICRACWNFLVENFAHFPQIAPLNELMKPFGTELNVWTESTELFDVFDQHAVSNGWLAYASLLPELVESIGDFPVLYKDMHKNSKDSHLDKDPNLDISAWRTISLRFPSIRDISTIWTAFKNTFGQYMSDIEFGVDNRWHYNWWRVLAKLKFLVEARYSTNEPYYYIVSNKMVEQIDRCALIEMKDRYTQNEDDATATGECSNSQQRSISPEVDLNGRKWQVEMVALLIAIEKHPIIYRKGDCMAKYEAWQSVAKELQMDVTDCLLTFRLASQKYCMYKRQDAFSRCHLNEKYFKRFDDIFRCVMPQARKKLNVKTPFELNKSVEDETASNSSEDLYYPESYISDISMANCDSNLVVKNWIYAIGNLPLNCNEQINSKLKGALQDYLPCGNYYKVKQ